MNDLIQKKHFHTFDALRFLAFMLVFLHHIPIPENSFLAYFSHSGGIGVQIFFILSGFLITYILLVEKNNQTFKFKNFITRRILRIWPLYYAMILFAFCTPTILNFLNLSSSDEGYSPNWLYPLLFLENYEMMFKHSFPNVSPLRVMWSLCIEEHFYIIWGLIFLFISNKKIPVFLISTLFIAIISRLIYAHYNIGTLDILTNVDYFSFGGILAYLLIFKSDVINLLNKLSTRLKWVISILILAIYITLPFLKFNQNIIEPLIVCSITTLLIAFTLSTKNELRINDKNIFSQLGKYTYGMYLFHTIIINLFLRIGLKLEINLYIIILLSLLTTIVISFLSFHLFEKQFLKFKKYFK